MSGRADRPLNGRKGGPPDRTAEHRRLPSLWALRPAVLFSLLLVAFLAIAVGGCSDGGDTGSTSTTADSGSATSGDIEAVVGQEIKVGDALVTVRALEPTFNPVAPAQRMSEQTPSAPEGNESFYQAYVKVENRGATPLRVDPEDFAFAVGSSVAGIEPTWSGPAARSLLKGSSIELLVTVKAKAGYQPVLLYSPSWHDGTIRVHQPVTETTETT
jgi:hypothetical protein